MIAEEAVLSTMIGCDRQTSSTMGIFLIDTLRTVLGCT